MKDGRGKGGREKALPCSHALRGNTRPSTLRVVGEAQVCRSAFLGRHRRPGKAVLQKDAERPPSASPRRAWERDEGPLTPGRQSTTITSPSKPSVAFLHPSALHLPSPCPSAPASLPVRPATCTSAASAPRCSTGSSPGSTAGSSSCGSTTPTSSGTSRRRWRRSSHGLHWLGIDWDEGPEVGGPYAPYYQSQRSDRYQAAVDEAAGRRPCLPRLRHDRGDPGRARGGRTREAAVRLQPPLHGRDARRAGPLRGRGPQGRGAAEDAPRRHAGARRPGPRRRSSSTGPASRTTSSSGPTARASITWPTWSTTTISRSRT